MQSKGRFILRGAGSTPTTRRWRANMPRRPQHWFPGLIGGQGVVHPSGAACTLNYAEVYPSVSWPRSV
jgi:hypothetical protein